jgi:hypothetical protein
MKRKYAIPHDAGRARSVAFAARRACVKLEPERAGAPSPGVEEVTRRGFNHRR